MVALLSVSHSWGEGYTHQAKKTARSFLLQKGRWRRKKGREGRGKKRMKIAWAEEYRRRAEEHHAR